VNSSTDWLEIEADAPQPAILLITDVYTPAWRAVALPGSSQSHYDLQPADYILRVVPLAAGHHRLRVEYAPAAYRAGKWVSVISWLVFIGAAGAAFRMRNRGGAIAGGARHEASHCARRLHAAGLLDDAALARITARR
jgi:hypothetical protein